MVYNRSRFLDKDNSQWLATAVVHWVLHFKTVWFRHLLLDQLAQDLGLGLFQFPDKLERSTVQPAGPMQ